jgi:hypothetical protein
MNPQCAVREACAVISLQHLSLIITIIKESQVKVSIHKKLTITDYVGCSQQPWPDRVIFVVSIGAMAFGMAQTLRPWLNNNPSLNESRSMSSTLRLIVHNVQA